MSATTSNPPTNAVNATGSATNPSYVVRQINVGITLGEGTFGQTASNQVTLSGLRVVANIAKRGAPAMDQASLRIYGMPPALMNQLSTLGVPQPMARPNNTIIIDAGDAVNGMSTVFVGQIQNAYQVLDDENSFFQIDSWTGQLQAMIPATPTSFPGGFDVATAMAGLATKMGMAFENNGVQVRMPSSYFAGTYRDQVLRLAKAANIEAYFDSATANQFATLAIWPKNGYRSSYPIPLIQASSGLIGYPKFMQYAIAFRCIFNPSLRLGGAVQINSTLYPPSNAQANSPRQQVQAAGANGIWYITKLALSLSSQEPNGPWFCECEGARLAGTPLPQ
ncbi:MAG TPA: hypothetical protein VL997_12765 [Dyella sp.]|nr:hypothetical protein [Dyella sp.]